MDERRSKPVKYKARNQKGSKPWLLILPMLLVTVVAVGVSIWAFFFRKSGTSVLPPDFAPQQIESNAESMTGGNTSKLDAPEGGGSVNVMFKDEVSIDLGDNKATLYYGNPSESTQDVLLQIVIQDTLIVQSGRIVPGNQVRTLNLVEGAKKSLQPGGYEGKLVISFYNPDTGEKAMVNSEIPVKITVSK